MNLTPPLPALHGAGRASPCPLPGRLTAGLVCIYLLFVLPLYVDNNAGSGLAMPQNILAWGTMTLCILAACAGLLRPGRARVAPFMMVAALAAGLLMLPWLWTASPLWRAHAAPRLAGIAGALLFALALCQVHLSPGLRRLLLNVVVISALVQAGEAMVQAWLPAAGLRLMDFEGTSPYGVFQQRNLLASWLATGCSVALYLAVTARSRRRALVRVLALYPLCTALTLTQSRVGVLAVVLSAILTAAADLPRLRGRPLAALRRVMLLTSLLVWCTGVSLWAMPAGEPADLVHEGSTQQRIRVLEGTATMIARHPLAGSGLGSFEARFPQALEDRGLLSLESDTFTHPHNEAMYVMAEGGVVALTGLLLLAGVWLWPAVYRLRHPVVNAPCPDTGRWLRGAPGLSAGGWLLPLTGLPVVMHMMTEYPLYQSAPHLMLLLVLFRAGLPEAVLHRVRVPALARAVVLTLAALCLLTLAVLSAGFGTQTALTEAEAEMNQGLLPVLPGAGWRTLTQAERLDRDRHLLAANTPGFLQRPGATAVFTVWGTRWLAVHNDADVSAALMLIARRRGDLAAAEQVRRRAARVFVHDDRFLPGGE